MTYNKSMRFIFFIFVVFLIAAPVKAQIYDGLGEVVPPEGAKGRYTTEQLEPVALALIPGEIVKTQVYRREDDVYHEFIIERLDGSVFELEYDAVSAKLYDVDVRNFVKGSPLPPGLMDTEDAKKIAQKAVSDKSSSRLPIRVKDLSVDVYKEELVYLVPVKQGPYKYTVIVNAFYGSVLDIEKD